MERFTPDLKEQHPQLYYEHVHRYLIAKEHIAGGRVLDLACGEGYGTAILAQKADTTIGIDIDSNAIDRAAKAYGSNSLSFKVSDCIQTKLESHSFDYITSFETIEHLESPQDFIAEIKRLLKPNGVLIISSPDKKEYSEVNNIANPHHLNELYHNEFKELLAAQFSYCSFAKQRLVAGSLIQADAPNNQTNIETGIYTGNINENEYTHSLKQGLYSFAICSNATLESIKLGLFENKEDSGFSWDATEQFRPTLKRLAKAQKELKTREMPPSIESLLSAISDIELQNKIVQQRLVDKENQISDLQKTSVLAQSKFNELEKRLDEKNATILELQKKIQSLESQRDKAATERENYQERYENLLSTFSWKATVPIRSIRRFLDRFRSK